MSIYLSASFLPIHPFNSAVYIISMKLYSTKLLIMASQKIKSVVYSLYITWLLRIIYQHWPFSLLWSESLCTPPLQSICWNPNAQCVVLGSEAFGRWLSCKGETLINGISTLINETPQSSLDPSTMWDTRSLQPIRGCHPVILAPWLISDF